MLNYLVPMLISIVPHMSQERYLKFIEERRQRKKPSLLVGSIVFLIGLFITIISLNIYNPSLVPNELRVISLNKKLNILVLGCDEIFEENEKGTKVIKGRSDSIIILSCNPFNNTLSVLNIPRDTKITIQGHGSEKINFLNSIGGPIFTKKCIEKLLKINIDNYVMVNVQGLNKIIDEIGGIVVDVPQRMQYQDTTAMLSIDLFPGKQILNGKQAVGFVRFRHDNLGDIGRIQRQQIFMRAVINKLLDPITFTKLPEIISIYKKTIITDLKSKEIIKIANFIRNVPHSNQSIVILPGEFGRYNKAGYWIPDQDEINNIVRKIFYGKSDPLRLNRLNLENIKISVLNGSKKDNYLGTKISTLLRKQGYTVTLCQDYENHVSRTKIYAQKANSEVALQVKYALGNIGELLSGNLGPPDSDITILAGDDLINQIGRISNKN